MSSSSHLIADDVKDNYRQLREERDQSWPQMAEQFRRDAKAAGALRGRGYEQLAEWADEEATADGPPARRRRRQSRTVTPTGPGQDAAQPGPDVVAAAPATAEPGSQQVTG